MNKRDFDSLMAAAREAVAHVKGEPTGVRVTVIPDLDVSEVRGKTGLSQIEFATTFGVNVATLRNWEQKRVKPMGPARVLLTVIDRQPAAVLAALRIGPKKSVRQRRKAA